MIFAHTLSQCILKPFSSEGPIDSRFSNARTRQLSPHVALSVVSGENTYANMTKSPYVYSQLENDHIRLLHFEPVEPARNLRRSWQRLRFGSKDRETSPPKLITEWTFEILEFKMSSAPAFEAVSYVWGKPVKTDDLLVGDHTIAITSSISSGLPYILASSTTGFLWIDQICINQDDVNERNAQVRVMGNIYERAEQVLAWLGKMNDRKAIPLAEFLREMDKTLDKYYGLAKRSSDAFDPYEDIIELLKGNPTYLEGFVALFRSSWFNRLWIVQEAVFCPTVTLVMASGGSVLKIADIDKIYKVLGAVRKNRPKFDKEYRALTSTSGHKAMFDICRMRRDRVESQVTWSFYFLLSTMGYREASDPRDYVYACLGFVDDPGIVINPDYNIGIEETFARCAKSIILGTKSLDILDTIREVKPFLEDHTSLPSWVPDWRKDHSYRSIFAEPLSTAVSQPLSLFNASCGRLPDISNTFPPNSPYLHLRGKVISEIEFVTQRPSSSASATTWDDWLTSLSINTILEQIKLKHPLRSDFTRVRLAKVIVLDGGAVGRSLTGRGVHPISDQMISELLAWYDKLLELKDTPGERLDNKYHENAMRFRILLLCTARRRVFSSNDGKLGFGPQMSLAGDQIIIAHGSKLPLIVRPAGTTGRYWLVGPCYFEDAMYGDACTWGEDEADEFILV